MQIFFTEVTYFTKSKSVQFRSQVVYKNSGEGKTFPLSMNLRRTLDNSQNIAHTCDKVPQLSFSVFYSISFYSFVSNLIS